MKISNLDERIHVLDAHSNVGTIMTEIADSGVQEEAFYVLDVGDIVRKHKVWKSLMPRVHPFYGKFWLFFFILYYIISLAQCKL